MGCVRYSFALVLAGSLLSSCGTLEPELAAAPTHLPLPTHTPSPTNTPLPTHTPSPTNTPLPTHTPSPTNTPLPTKTPVPPSATPKPPTPTPTLTATPTKDPTAVPTATYTPVPQLTEDERKYLQEVREYLAFLTEDIAQMQTLLRNPQPANADWQDQVGTIAGEAGLGSMWMIDTVPPVTLRDIQALGSDAATTCVEWLENISAGYYLKKPQRLAEAQSQLPVCNDKLDNVRIAVEERLTSNE